MSSARHGCTDLRLNKLKSQTRAAKGPDSPLSCQNRPGAGDNESLWNLFESLQIEEQCEQAWDTAPAVNSTKTLPPTLNNVELEGDHQQEKNFA
jgi:hypothetical protein